jgi:HEAT repeat protein
VPKDGELEAAYQSLFDDLKSRIVMVQSFATSAVTQNPPQFSEPAILALADDKQLAAFSVEGLKRLATLKSRATLVQSSSTSSPEYLRQPAIVALGEIGNPDDCQAMLDIASENKNYTQVEAYIAAGRICEEKAVSILSGLVPIADSQLSMGVAGGLGNTYSRSAVRPLINLLRSPDRNTRWNAADALATLTHRKSKEGIEDADSASRSYHELLSWWSLDGNTVPIYRSDECTSPQPLS